MFYKLYSTIVAMCERQGQNYLESPEKRILDISVSLLALFPSTPLIAIFALVKYVEDGEQPFFIQERVGKGGKLIKVVKIRSMRSGTESDEERVTRVGKWLRRTHLDELPQFFQVLNGEMTLVGPRPIKPEALNNAADKRGSQGDKMMEDYKLLKSGLTGIWQINGTGYQRDYLMYHPNKYYLEKSNLFSDIKIITKTIKKVLKI